MALTGMKQNINKAISTLFILTTLLMPVCFANEDTTKDQQTQIIPVEQITQEQSIQLKQTKKTHKEAKHVLGKFIHTLMLVGGSCIAIFVLLTIYQRFSNRQNKPVHNIDISKDLESPETIEDAVKLFIEKF